MPQDLSGLARIKATKDLFAKALAAACQEYANRGHRGKPIVYSHFTQGNQGRYQWAPLSARYAAAKAGATPRLKQGIKASGKRVPAGAGLPMLVRTGALREAITRGAATVRRVGDGFVITWTNDPAYAIYHHTGTPKMPRRSPVAMNAADMKAVLEAAQRWLSLTLGKAGAVPVGGAPGARARAG